MHEVVAEILESFRSRSFSRPAHAGNDDEFRRGVGLAFTSASRFSRRARHLLKFAAQWHARNLSISEGVEAALWLRCGCRKDRRDLLQLQNRIQWALNSAVECHPHTVEVVGSNPTAPTICLLTAFAAPDSLSPSSFVLSWLLPTFPTLELQAINGKTLLRLFRPMKMHNFRPRTGFPPM